MDQAIVMHENESEYIVVEMPVRLSAEDVLRLNAIASTTLIANSQGAHAAMDAAERSHNAARRASALLNTLEASRTCSFGDLTGDPGFAILLEIFICEARGETVTMTSACVRSGAPTTTALRYLNALIDRGCVEKQQSSADSRVYNVRLVPETRAELTKLLGD